MPYKSARQRAYMHIHHPEIAKRWDREYGDSMRTSSRKDQIKRAIMRKPKYGGPQGGRPNTGARVSGARATSGRNGIKYLSKRGPYGPPLKKHKGFRFPGTRDL